MVKAMVVQWLLLLLPLMLLAGDHKVCIQGKKGLLDACSDDDNVPVGFVDRVHFRLYMCDARVSPRKQGRGMYAPTPTPTSICWAAT